MIHGAGLSEVSPDPDNAVASQPDDLSPICPIGTKDGPFLARFSNDGLVRLQFPPITGRIEAVSAADPPEAITQSECWSECWSEWWRLTAEAVRSRLERREEAPLPALDLRGTPFQQSVWARLLKIPSGQVLTYGDLARDLGCSGAVRAVGGACGANPVPLLVPCHRVIAAQGRWGGFSADPNWKSRLLEREGWTTGADLPLFRDRNEADAS